MTALEPMLLVVIILSLSINISCQTIPDNFPLLKGPYLGQVPPGTTPVVFAPGIVSTGRKTNDLLIHV